ncbi:hypothetical protein CFP71_01360 [Amycolatopsis thailandensis]|uniref:Uncharacterized protein n=1 Tax=Amycolatopsis thailandensis TaxID=589330 RepID=A0A229SIH7_9PSEU|nr:hypothetical protein [Amycolatopsis thailandensis]OXM58690.1 hypothetical protein CFP71_01360 [Amycolatopsis thailandensis]
MDEFVSGAIQSPQGSEEWVKALTTFHALYDYWPWEVFPPGGWVIATLPDNAGTQVTLTVLGIRWMRDLAESLQTAPWHLAYLNQAVAEMDGSLHARLDAFHTAAHDQIVQDNEP